MRKTRSKFARIVLLAVVSLLFTTTPATAAVQFPSSDGGGISVDWAAQWENVHRLEDIAVQLCDHNTRDSNEAIARLQVMLVNSAGQSAQALAPVVMRVERYAANCKAYKNMYLGYNEPLAWVRIMYYGSTDGTKYYTKWVKNPFGNS